MSLKLPVSHAFTLFPQEPSITTEGGIFKEHEAMDCEPTHSHKYWVDESLISSNSPALQELLLLLLHDPSVSLVVGILVGQLFAVQPPRQFPFGQVKETYMVLSPSIVKLVNELVFPVQEKSIALFIVEQVSAQ